HFPRNTRKTRKELDWAGEATMLRTSGCPAIDGSKDCLSAVSPGALRRPLHASGGFTGMDRTARGVWHLRGTQ
ncbi:MAG: hypothetical protein IKO65_10810, partial [Victivallales bacterium]|nr:hypothetical protein [Victivallales bacterium]